MDETGVRPAALEMRLGTSAGRKIAAPPTVAADPPARAPRPAAPAGLVGAALARIGKLFKFPGNKAGK